MYGIGSYLSSHEVAAPSRPTPDTKDVKLIQELLGQSPAPAPASKPPNLKLDVSRGSVSCTYSYGSCHSSGSSNDNQLWSNQHLLYQTPQGNHHVAGYRCFQPASHYHNDASSSVSPSSSPQHHHQHSHHSHHSHHQRKHHQAAAAAAATSSSNALSLGSPGSPSPTHEHDKHHHHHSLQEMIRHFGRRLGHIRRQSECQESPKKREEDFRNRSQSLDAGARRNSRYSPHPFGTDCETTYKIYDEIIKQGTW